MLKFNNNNIFTGYIKQLLTSYNLPTCRIYSHEQAEYYKQNNTERADVYETTLSDSYIFSNHRRVFNYIKDGAIQQYIYTKSAGTSATTETGEYNWNRGKGYFENQKIINNTKNLEIKNIIYDTYTHEYLGNYLRFFRDYYNINLMPLYNCFSNKLCNNLIINSDKYTFEFDSDDANYKIYMLPVKLYNNYTIAIDCDTPVEICCGLYGKYYYTDQEADTVVPNTYILYPSLKFNNPIVYTKLKDIFSSLSRNSILELAKNEQDLKMFIKLPANAKSSIVILEGNYLNYNDELITYEYKNNYKANKSHLQNHTITNFENEAKEGFITSEEYYETRNFKPITKLELLTINTGESYPFSTKLIEYLIDNVIYELDENEDNITRTQRVISTLSGGKINGIEGIWDPRLQPAIYDFMVNKLAASELNKDIFGYVDKIAESLVSATDTTTQQTTTIANIDIYEDLYLADKE